MSGGNRVPLGSLKMVHVDDNDVDVMEKYVS